MISATDYEVEAFDLDAVTFVQDLGLPAATAEAIDRLDVGQYLDFGGGSCGYHLRLRRIQAGYVLRGTVRGCQ